jgi:hypothetical protein
MANLENERGGHRPSQRLSTPTDFRVASPDAGGLTSRATALGIGV